MATIFFVPLGCIMMILVESTWATNTSTLSFSPSPTRTHSLSQTVSEDTQTSSRSSSFTSSSSQTQTSSDVITTSRSGPSLTARTTTMSRSHEPTISLSYSSSRSLTGPTATPSMSTSYDPSASLSPTVETPTAYYPSDSFSHTLTGSTSNSRSHPSQTVTIEETRTRTFATFSRTTQLSSSGSQERTNSESKPTMSVSPTNSNSGTVSYLSWSGPPEPIDGTLLVDSTADLTRRPQITFVLSMDKWRTDTDYTHIIRECLVSTNGAVQRSRKMIADTTQMIVSDHNHQVLVLTLGYDPDFSLARGEVDTIYFVPHDFPAYLTVMGVQPIFMASAGVKVVAPKVPSEGDTRAMGSTMIGFSVITTFLSPAIAASGPQTSIGMLHSACLKPAARFLVTNSAGRTFYRWASAPLLAIGGGPWFSAIQFEEANIVFKNLLLVLGVGMIHTMAVWYRAFSWERRRRLYDPDSLPRQWREHAHLFFYPNLTFVVALVLLPSTLRATMYCFYREEWTLIGGLGAFYALFVVPLGYTIVMSGDGLVFTSAPWVPRHQPEQEHYDPRSDDNRSGESGEHNQQDDQYDENENHDVVLRNRTKAEFAKAVAKHWSMKFITTRGHWSPAECQLRTGLLYIMYMGEHKNFLAVEVFISAVIMALSTVRSDVTGRECQAVLGLDIAVLVLYALYLVVKVPHRCPAFSFMRATSCLVLTGLPISHLAMPYNSPELPGTTMGMVLLHACVCLAEAVITCVWLVRQIREVFSRLDDERQQLNSTRALYSSVKRHLAEEAVAHHEEVTKRRHMGYRDHNNDDTAALGGFTTPFLPSYHRRRSLEMEMTTIDRPQDPRTVHLRTIGDRIVQRANSSDGGNVEKNMLQLESRESARNWATLESMRLEARQWLDERESRHRREQEGGGGPRPRMESDFPYFRGNPDLDDLYDSL